MYQRKVLPNGVRLLTESVPGVRSAALGIWVGVGSRRETAADSGVPIYEDNSLATILSQLQLGQEIPESLYQVIVEIYVYFLQFDPEKPDGDGAPPQT